MKVYIAEKPSLGVEIAKSLGFSDRKDGYFLLDNGDVVTWLIGHVLENFMPEDYDPKYKNWDVKNLPIIPDEWEYKITPSKKAQFNVVKQLLSQSDSAVNCGDAGREGQLLVDEVLEFVGYNNPVERLWLNDMTPSGFRHALSNLRQNKALEPLLNSGKGRSYADWLIGMNFTALFTLASKEKGVKNVGRVKSPTLNLVVIRDRAIEDFKPQDFYELYADFDLGFRGKLKPCQEILSPDGYLINKNAVEEINDKVLSADGVIVSYAKKKQESSAPMPYTINTLQKECSKKFGISAKDVLGIAQDLYEKFKMTSYPRTESPFMPVSQKSSVVQSLKSVAEKSGFKVDSFVDYDRHHPVFNDSKLGEHHAIIPTGVFDKNITGLHKDVFDLIYKKTIAIFFPIRVVEVAEIQINVSSEVFLTKLSYVSAPGWSALYGKEAEQPNHPAGSTGEQIKVTGTEVKSCKTSAPSRFTEASLIDAMENIARYTEDKNAKGVLKSVLGIGTGATRADIIESLKRSKLIEPKGKNLISTSQGRALIDSLPDSVKSPVYTAEMEEKLKQLENNDITLKAFLDEVIEFVKNEVEQTGRHIKDKGVRKPTDKQLAFAQKLSQQHDTPLPPEALISSKACSDFIGRFIENKPNADGKTRSATPPSDKQLAFAQKLSKEKKKRLPKGAKTDWRVCKNFINECLNK